MASHLDAIEAAPPTSPPSMVLCRLAFISAFEICQSFEVTSCRDTLNYARKDYLQYLLLVMLRWQPRLFLAILLDVLLVSESSRADI